MSEDELTELRALGGRRRQRRGSPTGRAGGRAGDLDELRRLAAEGSKDAVDVLVEVAGEQGNAEELRRLAEQGNRDAADLLTEMGEEQFPSPIAELIGRVHAYVGCYEIFRRKAAIAKAYATPRMPTPGQGDPDVGTRRPAAG